MGDSLSRRGVNLTRRAAAPVYRNELCSRGHVYATRAVTHGEWPWGSPRVVLPLTSLLTIPLCLSVPLFLAFRSETHTRRTPGVAATLSRPRWRFYGVFCRCQVPFGRAGIAREGFTVRLGRYLRHGAFAAGEKERYGSGYFCGMSGEVRVRGDYGNLLRSLALLIRSRIKGYNDVI